MAAGAEDAGTIACCGETAILAAGSAEIGINEGGAEAVESAGAAESTEMVESTETAEPEGLSPDGSSLVFFFFDIGGGRRRARRRWRAKEDDLSFAFERNFRGA